jgi:hypothetical protein
MNQWRRIKNNKGISIIEALVGLGIASMVLYGLTSMQINQQKETRALSEKIGVLDVEKLLLQNLADGSLCTYMLTNTTYDPTNPRTFDQTLIGSPTPPTISLPGNQIVGSASATVATGPYLAKVGVSPSTNPNLVVNSIQINGIVDLGSNNYRADFEIGFDPTLLIRRPRPIKLTTILRTDASTPRNILSCAGFASTTNTFWAETGATDGIFYNAGKVGIGTTVLGAAPDFSPGIGLLEISGARAGLYVGGNDNGLNSIADLNLINRFAGQLSWWHQTLRANGDVQWHYRNTLTSATVPIVTMTMTPTGNFGFGTTTPSSTLHVSATDADPQIQIENTTSTSAHGPSVLVANYLGALGTSAHGFRLQAARGSKLAPSATAAFDDLGDISFQAHDGAGFKTSAAIASLSPANHTATSSPGDLLFGTTNVGAVAPTERMRILYNGNVGIGTRNPTTALEVNVSGTQGAATVVSATNDNLSASLNLRKSRGTSTAPTSVLLNDNLGSVWGWGYNGAGFTATASVKFMASENFTGVANGTDIVFMATPNGSVGAAELARIRGNGNVGIGTNSPGYKLEVIGDAAASGCLRASGSVVGGTCTSDVRLKKNIQSFDLGLEALLGFNPVTFERRGLANEPANGKKEIGLIAQDVEKTAPQLISTFSAKFNDSDPVAASIKQVNYTGLTYVLINAVKEIYSKLMTVLQNVRQLMNQVATKADASFVTSEIQKLREDNARKDLQIKELKAYLCHKDPAAEMCQ